MFRATYLVKRRSDFTFEQFYRYQLETHVHLALRLPGLKDYELDFFPPGEDGDQPWDAAAHLVFEDRAAHDAALASPEGREAVADLPKYSDPAQMRMLAGFPGLYRRDAACARVG